MDISIRQLAVAAVLFANFLFILFILAVERKKPAFALSWILTLFFLPALGFLLYLFLGTNVAVRRRKSRRMTSLADSAWEPCSENNAVEIFVTAKEKYRRLLRDIEAAEHSVHVLYFIIRNDRIGRLVLDLLARKAKQGVRVKLLYDHAGCWLTPRQTFRPLAESGAEVRRFFPICWGNYLRVNFRNHRKLVVIDGRIGYIGGMNIGEEYLGAPAGQLWRDTHLRIVGDAVAALQRRFFSDWRFASGRAAAEPEPSLPAAAIPATGGVRMRIVASGPDREEEEVKWAFLRMIYAAKRRIYIQTPYFIPDESFMEALRIAAFSGVKVTVMGSARSDNWVAHCVSRSYLGDLMRYGIAVYRYPGFLHAKMLLVDDAAVSLGSANMDMRSFSLNFELNALLYGREIVARCAELFAQDLREATRLAPEEYARRPVAERMVEGALRLLAPLL